jgi:nucleoside-diphosphate-sugar epimerase
MHIRPTPQVPAKVFITRANGFIAKNLADRLRELGAQVSGIDLAAAPAVVIHTAAWNGGPAPRG